MGIWKRGAIGVSGGARGRRGQVGPHQQRAEMALFCPSIPFPSQSLSVLNMIHARHIAPRSAAVALPLVTFASTAAVATALPSESLSLLYTPHT